MKKIYSNLSFVRVLVVTIVLTSPILILLATRQSKNVWSFSKEVDINRDVKTFVASNDGQSGPKDADVDIVNGNSTDVTTTLRLVQVLFRHGNRAPCTLFPSLFNPTDWPMGAGELTQLGMMQLYNLGQYIRHRYLDFIGPSFIPSQVYVRSTDASRTIMSAQCVVAGLFPGNLTSTTWPLGSWQPVPIHTYPPELDMVLSPVTVCPYVRSLRVNLTNLYDAKPQLLKNKEMMRQFEFYTGVEMNASTVHLLSHNIHSMITHNLAIPRWLTKEMVEKLLDHRVYRPSIPEHQARYLTGSLWQHMLSMMHSKLEDPLDTYNLRLFSAHDVNMHALMSLLHVHNDKMITSESAFFVELYERGHKLFVRMLYKMDSTTPISVLTARGCDNSMCPLNVLEKLYGDYKPGDWDEMCPNKSVVGYEYTHFTDQSVPILIATVFFLLALTVVLMYKACLYHNTLQQREYEEKFANVWKQPNKYGQDNNMLPDFSSSDLGAAPRKTVNKSTSA